MKKILLLLIVILPSLAFADSEPTTESTNDPAKHQYMISSGTGFFVNRQDIVTNNHVIKGCSEVIIKGAVAEQKAHVKSVDAEHDLAIIESLTPPSEFAPLRFNIDDLKTDDKVLLIGYPGEAGIRGETTIATSNIIDIKLNDSDKTKWLYINDVVEHGNSGGPVFDTSGNVIGVVVAKAVFSQFYTGTTEKAGEQNAGVVITLATLKQFLLNNGIFNEWSGSGLVYQDSYIVEKAKSYIVNVQCILPANQVSTSQ